MQKQFGKHHQSKTLIKLLSINFVMFILELGIGWRAESSALIADALDNFADFLVYGVALYAVGKSNELKTNAAMFSGMLQVILGLLVLGDVLRRFLYGSEPFSILMMFMGSFALLANLYCLRLIMRYHNAEVHMRASWIFTINDVFANLGVIIAGILVWQFNSHWPDIIIGSLVALIVLFGAKTIIHEVNEVLDSRK